MKWHEIWTTGFMIYSLSRILTEGRSRVAVARELAAFLIVMTSSFATRVTGILMIMLHWHGFLCEQLAMYVLARITMFFNGILQDIANSCQSLADNLYAIASYLRADDARSPGI